MNSMGVVRVSPSELDGCCSSQPKPSGCVSQSRDPLVEKGTIRPICCKVVHRKTSHIKAEKGLEGFAS